MAPICLRKLSLLLALLAGAASAAQHENPAPEPAPDCFSLLMNLSSCLDYVMPSSHVLQPRSDCCSALTSLLNSDEQSGTHTAATCMCDAFNGNAAGFSVQVNRTRAEALPALCFVSNARNCTAEGPSPAPALGPPTTVPPTSSIDNHSSSGSSSLVASVEMILCTAVFAAIFMHRPKNELGISIVAPN